LALTEIDKNHGREHLLAEGRRQGYRKSRVHVLTELSKRRFLSSPPGLDDLLSSASDAEIDRWTNNMLAAATYKDIAAASAAIASPMTHVLRYLEQVATDQLEELFDSFELNCPSVHKSILTSCDVAINRTRSKALAEGELIGLRLQHTNGLLKLLHRKFADVPPTVNDRVTGASDIELDRWTNKILSAANIDDVFAQ
jgi:hypothetical protein